MSGVGVFLAIMVSLAGLATLAMTDPKRRRAHGQLPLASRPFFWPARLAVFGPGLGLLLSGHWSGLTIWAGAITTLGWAMAAITPARYATALARARTHLRAALTQGQKLARGLRRALPRTPPKWRLPYLTRAAQNTATAAELATELTTLKTRITALEARLQRLEQTHQTQTTPLNHINAAE